MKLNNKNDKEEMHPMLPSGEWDGFYCYNHNPEQHKMQIDLNFKNTVITGSGVDDVAPFTWKGKYDLDKFKIFMTKTYHSHRVFYAGNVDENGIWGTWKISFESYNFPKELSEVLFDAFKEDCNGGFHIWPKKQNAASNKKSASKEKESERLKKLFVEIAK